MPRTPFLFLPITEGNTIHPEFAVTNDCLGTYLHARDPEAKVSAALRLAGEPGSLSRSIGARALVELACTRTDFQMLRRSALLYRGLETASKTDSDGPTTSYDLRCGFVNQALLIESPLFESVFLSGRQPTASVRHQVAEDRNRLIVQLDNYLTGVDETERKILIGFGSELCVSSLIDTDPESPFFPVQASLREDMIGDQIAGISLPAWDVTVMRRRAGSATPQVDRRVQVKTKRKGNEAPAPPVNPATATLEVQKIYLSDTKACLDNGFEYDGRINRIMNVIRPDSEVGNRAEVYAAFASDVQQKLALRD